MTEVSYFEWGPRFKHGSVLLQLEDELESWTELQQAERKGKGTERAPFSFLHTAAWRAQSVQSQNWRSTGFFIFPKNIYYIIWPLSKARQYKLYKLTATSITFPSRTPHSKIPGHHPKFQISSQRGNSEVNRSHPQRVTEELPAMSQEIRRCLDSSLQRLSVGLPRGRRGKWARKESTPATHRCTRKCWEGSDGGHLGKVLRTHSQSSMLEKNLVLPSMNFQCPLLFLGQKELRNELLITFSQARMGNKGFSSYIWKHVLARPST